MSAISGFCEKCNKFRKRHCDGNRNTCMSILFDTIEALQQENNGWRERYDELDAGHSRLFKDFCKLQQENEQLQAQNAAMREALEWAGSALGQSPCLCRADSECIRCQALTAIDKAGGGEDV